MASSDATRTQEQLQGEAVTQIANVSRLLRDAIGKAIPVAPDQYLTISIPGTVIDTNDIKKGGTFVYGEEYSSFVPPAVRQAEARLVDNMMPLSSVMVGNTGKSVSRSYSRALDGLVPKVATVPTGINQLRSPGEAKYDKAMTWLTKRDPESRQTPVEIYVRKQAAWADAQDAWDQAKLKAQQKAQAAFPSDLVKQRQDYDEWNQANFRKFKFAVQGRWMDWVTNGHKYEVESNFGIVDVDSIMARVEDSRESMRNSTMVDADGANELQGVILTPKNWATLCQWKANGWFERNDDYSLAQLDAEIARLTRLQLSYAALKELTDGSSVDYPVKGPTAPDDTPQEASTNLQAKFKALYQAEGDMNKQFELVAAKKTEADKDTVKATPAYTTAVQNLKTKREELDAEIQNNMKNHSANAKYAIANLSDQTTKTAMSSYLTTSLTTIGNQITSLQSKRADKLAKTPSAAPVIAGAHNEGGNVGTDLVNTEDLKADPIFKLEATSSRPRNTFVDAGDGSLADPWTTISASFSAVDQKSSTNTSSWGMSVGGGAGWGLWSVGGAYAHEQSSSDSVSDMASCDVSLTFSAMVVNINRPWLYGEIFDDHELDTADDVRLSPGAARLKQLMASQKDATNNPFGTNQQVLEELAQYNAFPAFPTSFIVAADTVIDFQGDTQHIEDHFSAQSNSGSISVGYGPFSVSSSFHHASSKQSHQVQQTATGCRLSFGAPQIIGWVSQIVPALPRPKGYEPMVQNVVAALAAESAPAADRTRPTS